MRSAALAEWLLSLVIPPDRAASTVGDLLEESNARGALWFWSGVLRTACSHVWRDLSASPFKMLRLAAWGWLANWVLGALLMAAYVIAPSLFLPRLGFHYEVPSWFNPVFTVMICTVVPFLAGLMVARRSEGREMAGVVAVLSLMAALQIVRIWWPIGYKLAEFCALALFMTAGAIHVRRHSPTLRGTPAR